MLCYGVELGVGSFLGGVSYVVYTTSELDGVY